VQDKPIDLTRLTEGSSSATEFQHRTIIQDLLSESPNRRKFFKTLGIASAMAGAVAAVEGTAHAQSTFTDFDILNFALNLEYLEAEFYTVATTGQTISQAGLTVTGSGATGPTTGGAQVALTGAALAIAQEIAKDEQTHVKFIQTAIASLGGTAIAKPAINLGALGIGFSSLGSFLTLARAFEDIGVTAYGGAAPLIVSKTVLGYAARILAVEAYHAGNIRLQIAQNSVQTTPPLDGADHLPPPSGSLYFPTDNNALTEIRTPQQVLYLAYGGASLSSGGFFPSGVNGIFNMSSATPATSDNTGTGTGSSNGTITANPNPATHTSNGDAITTISWNAPVGVTTVEIHLFSPTGPLFADGGPTGSAPTGPWVGNGLMFFLQNTSNGLPLAAANTLGTVTVTVV
jgi:hypothetical protein